MFSLVTPPNERERETLQLAHDKKMMLTYINEYERRCEFMNCTNTQF